MVYRDHNHRAIIPDNIKIVLTMRQHSHSTLMQSRKYPLAKQGPVLK